MHTPDEDYITEMITEVIDPPVVPKPPEVIDIQELKDDELFKPIEQIDIEIIIKKNKYKNVLKALSPLNIVGSTLILYGVGGMYKYRYTYSEYNFRMHSDVYFSMFMLFGAIIMA